MMEQTPTDSDQIKKLLRELVEEVIAEMTSSGAAGAYLTPNAFRGHKSNKSATEKSMPGGKVVGKESTDDTTIDETGEIMVRRGGEVMEEGRGRYNNFKTSDLMRNHAKISYGVREAKKILREVDFLVGICERLKSEEKVGSDQLWKRTKPDLVAINSHLKVIAQRIKNIGK